MAEIHPGPTCIIRAGWRGVDFSNPVLQENSWLLHFSLIMTDKWRPFAQCLQCVNTVLLYEGIPLHSLRFLWFVFFLSNYNISVETTFMFTDITGRNCIIKYYTYISVTLPHHPKCKKCLNDNVLLFFLSASTYHASKFYVPISGMTFNSDKKFPWILRRYYKKLTSLDSKFAQKH